MWTFNGRRLQAEDSKYLLYDGGIAILNVTMDAAGFYDCLSVEKSKGKEFRITMARYALYAKEKTREAHIIPTVNKHSKAGAESFQSSEQPSLLDEAANQKPVDSHSENLLLKLLGTGFALLFLFLLLWNFYKGHFSLPWKRREISSKPPRTAGLGSPALATEGSGSVKNCSAPQMNILC